jgi:hypothetical protein
MIKPLLAAGASAALILGATPVAALAGVHAYPPVRAVVNGVKLPAIAVGNVTYINWGALDVAHTPHKYLGGGVFNVLGHKVRGVVYRGATYLPWASIAPKVYPTRIQGGWSFTAKQDYQLIVNCPKKAYVGDWPRLIFETEDAGYPLAGQPFKLVINNGACVVTDKTYDDGSYEWGFSEDHPATDTFTLTWVDPAGVKHEVVRSIEFVDQEATPTPIPPDDEVVVQVPVTITNDQVFFDAAVNGQNVTFQLDTGAQMPLLNGADAAKLNLPNLGTVPIAGVTGSDEAYMSEMDLTLGGVTFHHVQCLVYPKYRGASLFGYSFFADRQYDLLLSEKHHTLSVLK